MKLMTMLVLFASLVLASAQSAAVKQRAQDLARQQKIDAAKKAEQKRKEAAAAIPPPPPRPIENWQQSGKDAYYVGRRAAERLLKAPATAKFSTPDLDKDTGWKPWGYAQWKVFGHVDAQNSFGALLRSDWLAVVQRNDDKFKVVYVQIGDDATGKMPGIRPAPPVVVSTNSTAQR